MTDTDIQKFMIKLPTALHRELMAYSGVKGSPLSDILVSWIEATWTQQPEHETLSRMVSDAVSPKKAAAKKALKK